MKLRAKLKENCYVRAQVESNSYNEDKRTVDVVFATETKDVKRYDWNNGRIFIEQLVLTTDAVRMKRLDNGAPVLDNHDRYTGTKGVLGVVENARIENGVGKATLRFSKRPEVDGTIQDIRDGILNFVSVGYTVHKYEIQPYKDGETPIYRAVDWEPTEISIAVVAADADSVIRSQKENNESEVELTGDVRTKEENLPINNLNNTNMLLKERALAVGLPETATEAEVVAAENKKRADEAAELTRVATETERTRVKTITEEVRKAKLKPEFATPFIESGKTIDEVRAAIIDEIAKTDAGIQGNVRVTGEGETEKTRKAIIAGLGLRAGLKESEFSDEEKELSKTYRSLSLLDLAKDALTRAGVDVKGMDKMEIAKRAITNSTSDFPILLEGTNRRVLLAAYRTAPDTWRQFCSIGSVGDFREYKRLRMGSFTRLDALGEGAEYKNKKITDADYEKVSATTFGNIINVSRQMIINDDLQAFARLTTMLGRAAARSIEEDVYALLALNSGNGPTMVDGNPLFHSTHGNLLTSGGVPSVTEFDAMRVKMAQQKDKDSNEYLDIRPAIWLGPLGLDGTAKVVNGSQYDPDASNKLQRPNKVNGLFSNIVGTPRLTGTPYYAFANPSDEAVIEVSFLDGNQNPVLESDEVFNIDGVQWKVRMDYGVGAVGFRGAIKNPGA